MNNPMPFFFIYCWAGACLALFLTNGCVMTTPPVQTTRVQAQEDRALLDERFTRLQGDLESVSGELELLRGDLQALQLHATTSSTMNQTTGLQTSLTALQQRVDNMEAARTQDKKELIEKLTITIKDFISTQESVKSPSPPGPHPTPENYGYEHIVANGQNLSSIARAYNVNMKAIIDVNEITQPDALRIGQKLFIPDPSHP